MVKIRIEGTKEEINKAVEKLPFRILSQSEPYKNRGKSEYYRVYVDVELK